VQQKSTGPTTVAIDETPPSITGITPDKPWYSTVVNPSGSALVTATIVDTGGSSGVNASSVQLTVGSHAPIAGALQSGSSTVFQFVVPFSQLAAGSNTVTIAAADAVNNSGSQTGTIHVDNTAPTFGTASVPTAWFSGSATISPAITVGVSDTGGSGVDQSSVKIQVSSSLGPYGPDTTGVTDSWSTLTGASFQPANTQGAVAFNFVMKDIAGNPATPSLQSINVDRKPPTVSGVTPPATCPSSGTCPAWTQGQTLNPSGTVTATAVVDDTGGSGPASAALQVAGHIVGGTTSDSSATRTYSFSVPVTYQATGHETPLAFTVTGTDLVGNTTPTASAGAGVLLIDDLGPSVNTITVNNGIGISGVKWFQYAASGDIDVQADIFDGGSGVMGTSLTLNSKGTSGVTDGTRLDHGTPSCTAPIAGVVTCHFTVALSLPGSGHQRQYNFVIAGTDNVGNPMQSTAVNPGNAGSVGIDGEKPVITFTVGSSGTTTYPANQADCNSGGTDSGNLFCGHDGSHFLRAGDGKYNLTFTVSDSFTAPDDVGSGADTSSGTCTMTGAPSCTVISGTFTIAADFSQATFSSGSDGTGTVSVTVNAKDKVGNAATPVTVSTIAVTRVKWVRNMAGKVDTIKASPVVSTLPAPGQIIVVGHDSDTKGPIVSLSPDGTIQWRAGHGNVTQISNNVAYSSATQRLYVLGDSADHLYVFDPTNVTSGTAAQLYNCQIDDGSNSCGTQPCGVAAGAPSLLGGTPERVLVADSGEHRLWAFSGSAGSCAGSNPTINGNGVTTWAAGPNAPTTDGSAVYIAHDATALSKIAFNGTAFGAVTDAATFVVPIFQMVSIADQLYFGDTNTPAHFYSYTTAFASNWAAGTAAAGTAGALNAPAIVSSSYVFDSDTASDGKFRGFKKDGSLAFTFPATGPGLNNLSGVAIDANNIIYFADDKNKELNAIQLTGTSTITAGRPPAFAAYTGVGTTTLGTAVATEPTIDANGVLYFASQAGNIYAIITDSTGALPPSPGSTWPRVGFDNCNSSNTAFSCQ